MEPSSISDGIHISEDVKNLLAERLNMINICRLSMIRKRQHLMGEILARPGLAPSTNEPIKCIYGFNLVNDGCPEKVKNNCEDCGAYCCDLHTPHSTHKDTTENDPNIVLRQQITASATLVTSDLTTDSVPEPRSNGGQNKAPRRGTRPDLNQRYLAITGRQTLDSKHKSLKVAEFKLIVEALEQGGTPQSLLATALAATNSPSNGSVAVASQPTAQLSREHSSNSDRAGVQPGAVIGNPPIAAPNPLPVLPTDQTMSLLFMLLLQSNPALKEQLISSMQASIPANKEGIPRNESNISYARGDTGLDSDGSNYDDSND
jgi:hypothetical protein